MHGSIPPTPAPLIELTNRVDALGRRVGELEKKVGDPGEGLIRDFKLSDGAWTEIRLQQLEMRDRLESVVEKQAGLNTLVAMLAAAQVTIVILLGVLMWGVFSR